MDIDLLRVPARHLVCGGAAALAAFALGSAAAQAADLDCGSVVTSDVTLTHDITGCAGDGLLVGADGITIDLGGHEVRGTGSGFSGVRDDGHSDITITNGRVSGFVIGVLVVGSQNATVAQIEATDNQFGIGFLSSLASRVVHSTANENGLPNDNGNGITVQGAHGTVVDHTTTNGNGFGGINVLNGSTGTTVTRAVANGNHLSGVLVQASTGTSLSDLVTNANRFNGLGVSAAAAATSISRATANANGADGIRTDSATTTLTRTLTNANGGHGVVAAPGVTATGAKARGNKTAPDCIGIPCT